MRRTFLGAIVVTLGLLVGAPAIAQSGSSDVAADQAAIRQVWVDYAHAVETGNVDAYMSLWMAGGVQMPPNVPPNIGLDMIRANTGVGKRSGTIVMNIDPQEITVLGDWAYTRGMYTVDSTPTGGGATGHVDGKFMTILRRQADGSWKIYRDIFNSNVAP